MGLLLFSPSLKIFLWSNHFDEVGQKDDVEQNFAEDKYKQKCLIE